MIHTNYLPIVYIFICTIHVGAWSNLNEGEDINTISTSHFKDLLAVGDNQGILRLFQHPCTNEEV